MVDYTIDCTVDYNVFVVHCTVACSIDQCMVSSTNYGFSSMIRFITFLTSKRLKVEL